jgi:hypothetical protein
MTFTHAVSTNNYGPAKFIVTSSAANGTHTTIQAAITAATSGDTVFIRTGSYTEDLTLKAGVNLVAFQGDAYTPNVMIIGNATLSDAGSVSISGIRLQTNSAAFLTVSGSAASIVNLTDCYLNCSNSTGIIYSSSNAASNINIYDCKGDIGTTGISLFTSTGAGQIGFINAAITNSGGSTTASTTSTAAINVFRSNFVFPFSTSSTGTLNFDNTIVQLAGNTTCITTAGTGATNVLVNCKFVSGTASAISIGSGTTAGIYDCIINSSNASAIAGAGTVSHSGIAYINTSSVIGATTIIDRGFGRSGTFTPGFAFGGAAVGITYTVQQGNYTMIGNVVTINIRLGISSKGSSTGTASITGLPVANGSTILTGVPVNTFGGLTLTATFGTVSLSMDASATTATILASSGAAGASTINVTDAMFANASTMRITGSYLIV